jgi:ATP adenylyltransferase
VVLIAGMDQLWSPWRAEYITKSPKEKEEDGHIFERIAQSSEDEKHYVLLRRKTCFALLNTYPYNAGHLMVVPYRRVASIDDLTDTEWAEIGSMLKELKAALTAAFQPHGFNIGINLGAAAGAGIADHLHVHLVPRWDHDANFMTTTAQTRVHPNDLPNVYQQVRKHLP